MTSNVSRRTPSDYNVELGDEFTARAPSKRRRILGGVAVAICLSVASLIIVLAALRVQREKDAQSLRDSLQLEQLREGWKTLVGAAAVDAQRVADPVTVAAPVVPLATIVDTNTPSAEAVPVATDPVIVPEPVRPTRGPVPFHARSVPTRNKNAQPAARSAGRALDNPPPVDVPTLVVPDGSSVNVPEQGATGVGSAAPPVPSNSASQPVPVQPDDAAKPAPTPPLPNGSVPDSALTPPLPSGNVPDSVP